MGELGNLNQHDSCHASDGCCEGSEPCGPVYRHEDAEPAVMAMDEQDSLEPEATARLVGGLSLVPASYFHLPDGLSPSSNFPVSSPRGLFEIKEE